MKNVKYVKYEKLNENILRKNMNSKVVIYET